jgi:hypothetical protein
VGPYSVLSRVYHETGKPVEGGTTFAIGTGGTTYDLGPSESVELSVLLRHDIGNLPRGRYPVDGIVTDLGVELPARPLIISWIRHSHDGPTRR